MIDVTLSRLWNGDPAEPSEHVRVTALLEAPGLSMRVDAPWHGDPLPPSPPGRCMGLWDHEVVELFLVGRDGRYLELELGPHGHYLALELDAPRRIARSDLDLEYRVTRAAGRWIGIAAVPGAWLPQPVERWNAYAIHGAGDGRRHLAAHPVPGAKPDFHRLDLFPLLRRG